MRAAVISLVHDPKLTEIDAMPAAKRSADAMAEPRRRSGRLSSTPKKSNYFEDPETDSEEDNLPPKKRGRPSKRASLVAQESEEQYDEENETEDVKVEEEEEERPRKRGRPPKKTKLVKKESEDQYEDDEEEEEDDDFDEERDEDAPMRKKIIPLEQMRDTGGIDYEDYKIHKNTLLFLKDLKANNRRPWLKCECPRLDVALRDAEADNIIAHDGEYRRALQDWNSFVETTTQKITEIDETVPELPVKDIIFRIHRDIRFSKDPTPYKVGS